MAASQTLPASTIASGMDQALEQSRRNLRRLRWLALGLVLPPLALAAAILWIRPSAPRAIRLYTEPAGSTNAAWGERFAALLRERGLEVELETILGPGERLHRVAGARGDAAALVLGGAEQLLGGPAAGETLTSLGTVLIEPLWIFAAPSIATEGEGARRLAELRVGSGPPESASGMFATEYFRDNGLDPAALVRLTTGQGQAADALLANGELDAVLVAGLPGAPAVRSLLASPAARPLSFDRAAAYRVRHPWLLPVTVPQGLFDLGANRPPTDLQLLAVGMNVVVPKRMHPAAVKVMIEAAREAVRGGTEQPLRMIAERLDLPTPDHTTLPINPAAQAYYDRRDEQDVKYLVFRLLPYPIARWIDRWGIVLVALIASLLGVVKVLPALVKANFALRLNRAYRAMAEVEKSLATAGADRAALLARLDAIDRASLSLPVPRPSGAEFMDFRQFLHDLRSRIEDGDTNR